MRFFRLLVIGLFLSFASSASEAECDSECKLAQIEVYFDNIDKILTLSSLMFMMM